MTLAAAQWIVAAIGGYLAVGLVFAIAFVSLGMARVDPAATDMPLSARLLIIPGATALWPLMLRKWARRQTPPVS